MTVFRVKGINRVKSKGRWYFYHCATGTRLKGEPGSPEFLAELARIGAFLEKKKAQPASLELIIEEYRKSPFWGDLRPATQFSYNRAFDVLKPLFQMPLSEITPGFVAGLRDKIAEARGRWMAHYVKTVLSIIFDYAREKCWIQNNPTKGVRKLKRDRS
jgi:hypothetical protein